MTPDQLLQQGVQAMGLQLPSRAGEQLGAYLRLLEKWNRAYNLTAVRDPLEMVTRHLLDSLAVLPWLHGERVLDVGTGAGLPGIPLAIARPASTFALLDSNAKKTRFLTQAVAELALANVEVITARAEQFRPPELFTTVVSRAFAAIPDMLAACAHLCHPAGRLLAMKGKRPDAELAALPPGFRLVQVQPLIVPGLAGERHIVIIKPA